MKFLLAFIFLSVAATAHGQYVNTNGGIITRYEVLPRTLNLDGVGVIHKPTWALYRGAGFLPLQTAQPGPGEMVVSNWYEIAGDVAIERIAVTNAPMESPYRVAAAITAEAWPLLVDHPATNDIPAGGLTYRLMGTNSLVTWWVVREDFIATQISAHDETGAPIIHTVNLSTGEDETIKLRKIINATRFQDIRDARQVKTNNVRRLEGR